jgi:glycosyltransferase involved in cell wall biosynthesis
MSLHQPRAEQMKSFVSILIPCYNSEDWVARTIESALAQTWAEKEVIVVDDGSTDESLNIIRSFGDRIRWESGPNRGGNAARNRLLELARGEWLQYVDADDYLLPDKVARQMEFLGVRATADVLFGPVMIEYQTETGVHRRILPIPEPHDPWVLLARWYLPQTGACLWRRQAIVDAGGWRTDQPCCQEHELYLRMLMAGKSFTYCEHAEAVYRQWGEHTVCKRDVPEVHRRRLEIEQRVEEFLRRNNELTRERLHAVNLARFEIARSEWQFNEDFAGKIMDGVYRSEPDFIPDDTRAAPRRYRIALRSLGFRRTELLAKWLRGNSIRTLGSYAAREGKLDSSVR